MPEDCPECGQKQKLEPGFYWGALYVSYWLSVTLIAMIFIVYWLVFGLSHLDYSIYYALITCAVLTILLQPWIMRLARVIYLYVFVRYRKGAIWRSEA